MGFELLQLPEELISGIIEHVAALHDPPSRPLKAGFRCLLDDSAVAELSLTCHKIRRLALPILFRSLRIAPGFISPNTTKGSVREKDMQPFVDTLRRIYPWRRECVKHLHVFHCKGNLQAFSLDILNLFPALETIELVTELWDDALVLQAIHSHPTLQRCTFPHVNWASASGDVSLPYRDMRRIAWRSFTVTIGNNSHLQRFLEAGLQIEQLHVIHTSLDWTRLKFPSALKAIYLMADIADRCSLLWDFIADHPSVQILDLKHEDASVYILQQIDAEVVQILAEEPQSRISSAQLLKTNSKWLVKDIYIDIVYNGEGFLHFEGFSAKMQRFGRYLRGLQSLSISIVAPNGAQLQPGLSLQRVFNEAISTFSTLKHLSIRIPRAISTHFKAYKYPLDLDPASHSGLFGWVYDIAALQLSHSIAIAAPALERITYLGIPTSSSVSAGYRAFFVLVDRRTTVQVFEAMMQTSQSGVGMASEFVPIRKAWVPAGVL